VKRPLFNDDYEAFRATVRAFYLDQVVPEYPEWERAGAPPRHFWTAAGKLGLLGTQVPVEYGGGGQESLLFKRRAHRGVATAPRPSSRTARTVSRIYAGSSEVMKVIIAKSLGL
jgi:alkylation response protein AidB-like acyl-CoA dehydrogenase